MIYVIVKRVAHSLRGVPWPLARVETSSSERTLFPFGDWDVNCHIS